MTIKKIGKWFLRVVLAIVGIIVVALLVTVTVNQIALSKETKKIEDYGQKIDVYDGKMNVRVDGKGKEMIVLLPGYGTPSPGIDFKPLINELKPDYQVATIE